MKEIKSETLKKVGVVVFLFIFLLVFFAKLISNGFVFGYRTTFVLSGSMEPEIPVFSILLERQCERGNKISVDDVITYTVREDETKKRITHRVVRIDQKDIITKGDANQNEDPWVITTDNVEGTVVFVFPYTLYAISGVAILLINGFFVYKRICKKSYCKRKYI